MSTAATDSRREQEGPGPPTAVRGLLTRVYAEGDLRLVDELVAPTLRGRSSLREKSIGGPGDLKAQVSRVRLALHGLTIDIEALEANRSTVDVAWRAQGTLERPLVDYEPHCSVGPAGVEPHGNPVSVRGVTRSRVSQGRIVEWEMQWDVDALGRQVNTATPARVERPRRRQPDPLAE